MSNVKAIAIDHRRVFILPSAIALWMSVALIMVTSA